MQPASSEHVHGYSSIMSSRTEVVPSGNRNVQQDHKCSITNAASPVSSCIGVYPGLRV